MKVALSSEESIPSSPAEVWARLLDHEFVAACAPGVESVEKLDPCHFRAVSSFGAGAVRLRFRFEVALADLVEPESITLNAKGKAPGTEVTVDTALRLHAEGPGTRLAWTAEVNARGLLARIGARLVAGESERQLRDFWKRFATGAEG